jgi:predicted transposase YbfD/YdcC
MMNFTMLPLSVQLPDEPFAFSLEELANALAEVQDLRKQRGRRYPLCALLVIAVLAKLAGYAKLRDVAEWARLRQAELCPLLGLQRRVLPHPTTWSRIFASGLDPAQLEQDVASFFKRQFAQAPPKRGSIVLNIDGKTLRGTIPSGSKQGVHLVAAYLPQQGVVLAQLAVRHKANELTVVPSLLGQIDLHGVVVSGDAIFAQRNLSVQIVEAGGDYIWTVKGNQESLRDDIAWLFAPLRAGERAEEFDWRTAVEVRKGHGRIEEREITVSRVLAGYSEWPYLEQVFKLRVVRTEAGKTTESVRYGVTSLPMQVASPRRLMELMRQHWGIEGGLHQRRDVSLQEDRSQVRLGQAPRVLASLNNIVVGLVLQAGEQNLAAVQRAFAYRLDKALHRGKNEPAVAQVASAAKRPSLQLEPYRAAKLQALSA